MESEQINSHTLTQRIVGAIVLISLGIIFIPLFLETDKINPGKIEESPIPEVPGEISTIVFQLNEETGKFEEKGVSKSREFTEQIQQEISSSLDSIETVEEDSVTSTPPKPSSVEQMERMVEAPSPSTSEKITNTWILQLASFKDEANATALRDKIRTRGFVSFIDKQITESGAIWRVRVGPELRKSKILEIQAKLESEFKLKGLVIRRR